MCLITVALTVLCAIDLVLKAGGIRPLHRLIQKSRPARVPLLRGRPVEQITEALQEACRLYPKAVLCLHRSAALTLLLRSAGYRPTMVLGCRQMPFAAHAWVELGGCVLNDKQSVLSSYEVLDRL